MSGFDIVTAFAIILFARLGIRLVYKYRELNKEKKEKEEESEKNERQ
jgi:hypothetical protein